MKIQKALSVFLCFVLLTGCSVQEPETATDETQAAQTTLPPDAANTPETPPRKPASGRAPLVKKQDALSTETAASQPDDAAEAVQNQTAETSTATLSTTPVEDKPVSTSPPVVETEAPATEPAETEPPAETTQPTTEATEPPVEATQPTPEATESPPEETTEPEAAEIDGVTVRRKLNIYIEPTDEPGQYLLYCFYGGE